jgi:cellobiose-specific phosphotransferase system component IIA
MGENTALVLQLLLIAAESTQKWAQLVATANSENRDVSDEELDSARADYKTAHDNLDAALKA